MSILKLISTTLYMGEDEVKRFIDQSPHRYKVYKIAKRNSDKKRTIAQPSKELKFIQRLVMNEYFRDLPVHPCAQAYVEGKGIKLNARAHLGSSFLLKMDFKDFFPSIKPEAFLAYLQEKGFDFDESDRECIERIFFWRPRNSPGLLLSIGAPSSPRISNLVMFTFDKKVEDYCKEKGITYTRYADDLTFTTNEQGVLFSIPDFIENVCSQIQYPELTINSEKTVFSSKKHNRHVTGLVLTNDNKISIGRDKKREIKALVHRYINGFLEEHDINRLKGYLAYIHDVEPAFINSLQAKYGSHVIYSIKHYGVE